MQTQNFLLKHSKELSKKYSGEYIAIVEDKVVAVSKSRIEAYKRVSTQKITFVYIPARRNGDPFMKFPAHFTNHFQSGINSISLPSIFSFPSKSSVITRP